MARAEIADRIATHLSVIVEQIGARPPGTPANRLATDYVREVLCGAGLSVVQLPFRARYWTPGRAELDLSGETLAVEANPFSPPGDVGGPVARISSRGDLVADWSLRGAVIVLVGELAAAPYFPKAYPFISFPDQLEVIRLIEQEEPAAVIAVAPSEAPFVPVFEDADLAFPSVTVPPSIGARLVQRADVRLRIGGETLEGQGVNVSGFVGGHATDERILVSAHIDTKAGTPGAFDNGGSVAALLALVESGGLAGLGPLELVFFNGEDDFAAPGEQAWLAAHDPSRIRMVVNADGVGLAGRPSTVAPIACSPEIDRRLRTLLAGRPGWAVAEPWYESDHSIFAMRGIPGIALTTADPGPLLVSLAHRSHDTVDKVDTAILADVGRFVGDWLRIVHAERLV